MSAAPAATAPATWPLGPPPPDYVLGHVRAVLPDRVVEDARIVVRNGRIAEVGPHPPASRADVDGAGLLCLPGLVDVHSDGLESERRPRPGVELPWEFAVGSFEGKLRAAGITTVLHGASFQDRDLTANGRSIEHATRLCDAVDARGPGPVDHRVLHRLDVRCPHGFAALRTRLQVTADGSDGRDVPVVSHEDHTPGQGQYADRTYYERFLVGRHGITEEQARTEVDVLVADRDARLDVRDLALDWLGERARAGAVRLLGHDPASAPEIEALAARGGTVAEFPTTLEAAQAAWDAGMAVVAGAPNVLRGRSHSGNVSATELVAAGLVTALASDYLPAGLLAAALTVADRKVLPLPAAVRLVTEGPAVVAGLADRGRLSVGLRADLALVEIGGRYPLVQATLACWR